MDDDEQRYKKLIESAKTYSAEGKLIEAIHSFEQANKIKFTDKTAKRIQILQEALEDSDVDENFVKLKSGLIMYKNFAERLYPHQHEGVNWLYTLHRTGAKGGLLADDMGLGKTIQIIAFLSALFDMKAIKSVLLVLPLSLIENWSKEFKKWAPGISLRYFRGSKADRNMSLKYVQRHPGVLMTTYGLIVTQWETLAVNCLGHDFTWDYTILDEGHRIKNPTKTTKGIHAIPSRHRVILTGTPVQNNLKELWSLFDWTMQGSLLGRRKTFQMEFETPILASRKKGASPGEIAYGNRIAQNLRKIIDPYLLRRTKASVQKVKQDSTEDNQGPSFPKLKKKTDLVVWTYISKTQAEIYKAFVEQESVKELLMTKRSPLVELVQMKKICDHPRLLSRRCCKELGLQANDSLNDSQIHSSLNDECAANKIDNITDETLIAESGKLKFLLELLNGLRSQGHRALVFSRSKKILNMVERILTNRKFKLIRLDGSITKIEERSRRVQAFQTDDSYNVFLLTVQVGGVGLTLTSADRAIIYDPSWNPADDAQAIDRIYRIGQQKNVIVYRLITCGTLEEKIFRRQVFKNSIIKQTNGEISDPYRYFTNHELRDLFVLNDPTHSATQVQLQELHGKLSLDQTAEEHINYLHTLEMFGVSYHELMFSAKADDVDEDEQQQYQEELNSRVKAAQNRLQDEVIFAGQNDENQEMRWGGSLDRNTRDRQNNVKTETSPLHDLTNQISEINVKGETSPMRKFFPKPDNNFVNLVDDDDDIRPVESPFNQYGTRPVPPVVHDLDADLRPVPVTHHVLDDDIRPVESPITSNNTRTVQSPVTLNNDAVIDLLTDSESGSDDDEMMTNSNFIDYSARDSDISSEDELLEDLINKSIILPNQRRNELLDDDSFENEIESSEKKKKNYVIDETLDESLQTGNDDMHPNANNAESSSLANAESSSLANAESSSLANAESSSLANAESSSLANAESSSLANAESSSLANTDVSPNHDNNQPTPHHDLPFKTPTDPEHTDVVSTTHDVGTEHNEEVTEESDDKQNSEEEDLQLPESESILSNINDSANMNDDQAQEESKIEDDDAAKLPDNNDELFIPNEDDSNINADSSDVMKTDKLDDDEEDSDASTNLSSTNNSEDEEEYTSLEDRVRSSMSESLNSTKNLSFESDDNMSRNESSIAFPNESELSLSGMKPKNRNNDFVIPDSDESADESISMTQPLSAVSNHKFKELMSSTPNAANKKDSSSVFISPNDTRSLNGSETSKFSFNNSTKNSDIKLMLSSVSGDEEDSILDEE